MKIFRVRHDNVPESPIRTLYGRKGNLLLLPLDVCILQFSNGVEEFRPPLEVARLIAAPVQEQGGGRLGLIAQYEWSPYPGAAVNPVVTVQLAPSANLKNGPKGVPDLRVLASLTRVDDKIFLEDNDIGSNGANGTNAAARLPRAEGVVVTLSQWHEYPDLTHRVMAYSVEFHQHLDRTLHGSAVRRDTGELVGMLIATENQPDGTCRALVYPA